MASSPVHILEHLAISFPEKEIAARLGQRQGAPRLLDEARFAEAAQRAFALCAPRGRYCLLPIEAVQADGILLVDGTRVQGARFAEQCVGRRWLWCAAVTVGAEVVAARQALPSMAEQCVYDAVASECADAAMDALQRVSMQLLLSQGFMIDRRRYSPGYGDMPLQTQALFDRYLDLGAMGVALTPEYFMIPEKSVTAWAGVAKAEQQNEPTRIS